jgi:hypothetical protein
MSKKKLIELSEKDDRDLKIMSALSGMSQKKLIEMAISDFIQSKKSEFEYLNRQ